MKDFMQQHLHPLREWEIELSNLIMGDFQFCFSVKIWTSCSRFLSLTMYTISYSWMLNFFCYDCMLNDMILYVLYLILILKLKLHHRHVDSFIIMVLYSCNILT